jgi:hypothetical protein
MSVKAFKVDRFIVRNAVLPHTPEYFEPTLTQASQRAGVTMSLGAFGRIVGLSPQAGSSTLVGPKMHGVTQEAVAGPADPGLADLTRFETHRAGSGAAAQALSVGKHLAASSNFGQEPRCQFVFGAR